VYDYIGALYFCYNVICKFFTVFCGGTGIGVSLSPTGPDASETAHLREHRDLLNKTPRRFRRSHDSTVQHRKNIFTSHSQQRPQPSTKNGPW